MGSGAAERHEDAWAVSAAPRRGPLSLQLSERKLLLFAGDVLLANGALAVSLAWRLRLRPDWHIVRDNYTWFLILTGIWIVVSFLFDGYDLRRAARLRAGAATGAAISLVAAAVYMLIPRLTPPLPSSRVSLAVFFGAIVGAVTVWRSFYALVLVRPALRRRALVVGAGWSGRTIVQAILEHAAAEYDLVGYVDDDPGKQGKKIGALSVLGNREDLDRLVRRTGASEIIVAITQPDRMHPKLFQAVMDCHEHGVHITEMPVLFEQLTGRVPVEHAGRNLHMVLPLNGYPSHAQRSVKWLGDGLIGLVGVVFTAMLVPFVWLALAFESKGPLFYRQRRVGRGGRPFELLKFRTMVRDAEVNGPQWAEEHDRRVTRVGRVLRRLHIDEIPQAVNILRGELSFVGPRPERPEFVAELEQKIPFYRARHAVRPGVTGWAQVNYGYGASVEDALIKLQYDLFYIKYQSLWLDLVIFFKTMGLILTLRGR